MPDPFESLREAIDAVAVRPPLSFSWFGATAAPIPARMRRGLTQDHLRLHLEEHLARTLYANFYCRGSAAPPASGDGTVRPDDVFVRSLSRVNRGTGCVDPGWRFVAGNGPGGVFAKGGLAFTVRGAERSRFPTTIVLPKELLRLAPGFYTALGDRALHSRAAVVRIYWNVEAAGAASLVDSLTRSLNDQRIPFRFKIANHPASFERCDAAVLYADRRDRARVWPLLKIIRRRLGSHLGATVPSFTKAIAPGVAAAEEPPSGDSFGMDRCRLMAGALVRSAFLKKRGTEERLRDIEAAFEERGLALAKPYLNPRSRDVYPSLTS